MSFEIVSYERKKEKVSVKHLGLETAKKVQRFHSSFPIYKKTPLVELNNLAKELKVKNIYVKDESYRFGLNAFKVLGGSFAIGNYIAKKLVEDIENMPYERMISKEVREKLGDSWASMWTGNLLPVTLGNILGGCLVGVVYWAVYLRRGRRA